MIQWNKHICALSILLLCVDDSELHAYFVYSVWLYAAFMMVTYSQS